MFRFGLGIAALSVALLATGQGHANDFVGWCMSDGGCMGSIPITEDGFILCEHNCTMNNPVSVNGMDGTLYDVFCTGDAGSIEQRMLFMKYTDFQGSEQGVALSPNGPRELERCE